jgi:hypothetical protein
MAAGTPEARGVWVASVDGSPARRLIDAGHLIIFSRQADDDYEIYSIRPDGTGVKRLTHARGTSSFC